MFLLGILLQGWGSRGGQQILLFNSTWLWRPGKEEQIQGLGFLPQQTKPKPTKTTPRTQHTKVQFLNLKLNTFYPPPRFFLLDPALEKSRIILSVSRFLQSQIELVFTILFVLTWKHRQNQTSSNHKTTPLHQLRTKTTPKPPNFSSGSQCQRQAVCAQQAANSSRERCSR